MSRFIPQNAPADPSTGSTRKLTIYYQQRTDDSAVESSERPNTDGPAVAPTLDGSTDVARPVLRKLVAHVTQMTVDGQNAIPLEPTFNIRPASGDDANQPRYVSQNEQLNVSKIDPTPFVSPATMWNPQAFEAVGLSNTEADFGAKKNVLGSSAPVDNGKTKSLKAYLSSGKHGKFIDQQLLETTGFNEEHKFLDPTGDGTQPDTKLELGSVFYNQLGAYAKTSYVGQPTISGQTVAAKRLTVEDMQILALNSLFDASQGGADFDFVVTKDNTVEAEARAAVPSPTRLGKKISLGRFSGARELKKVYGIDKGSRTTFIDNTDSLETYGSFYSPYSQFNTLVPTGQVAVAVALVVAFTLVLESVGFLVQQGSGDGTIVGYASLSTQEKADLLGTSVLKSSTVYPKGKITSGLDFLRDVSGVTTLFDTVQHNRGDCLFAGLEEFFGFRLLGNFNATGNTAAVQQLATASSKILTESGRISTLLREILRSGIGLLSDVAAIPSEGFSVAGASALLERLKRLKLVSFINVLMNLGDRVLQNQDIVQDAADNGNPDYNTDGRSTVSFIDSLPDVRRNYIAKSRLSKNGKLAWGMSTTSMLSLPLGSLYNPGAGTNRNLREAGVSLVEGYPDVINTDGNEQPNFRTAGDRNQAVRSGRISADMVAKYEQSLESDYMPFYIHDLRTNEIVQFHAFLEDVGEDFSVEYTAQEGYGRQDKVQTHRGTTRTVTVSFKMVATNEDDHSVMWYKLNKLVTMIYPQWTQGREVNVDNVRFIQPFSQIPGASPVVRLRLGDLFKTNFSKMAVARLFGATTLSTFNVQGNRAAPTADGRASNRDGSVPTGATTTTTDSTSANSALMYGPVSILNSQNLTIMARAATAVGLSPVVTPDQLFQPGDKLVLKPEVLSQYLRGYSASNTPFTKLITQESRIVAEYVRTDSQTSKVVLQLKNYIRDIRVGGSSFLGNNDIGGYPTVPINAQAGTSPTLQLPLNTSNVFARALDQQRTARELQKRIDSSQNRTVRDEQQVVTGQPTTSGSVSTARNTSTAGLESLTGQQFFSETENPVLKAFKSSGGQGLAGVITSFKVDYSEAKGSWSTDGSTKSRAPKFVTVNLGMSVIHDITPGLDANGIMTAPVWPVGPYSNYYMNNGNTTTPPTANDAQSVSAQGNINRFNPLSNPTLNRKG